jgi:CDGSH-type Zn-finger protein
MSEEAIVAQKAPYQVELVEGKTYHWCTCGRSSKQPFCDGSHQGTSFVPLSYSADKTGSAYLCGCKKTANQPQCDGSHKAI